MSFLIKVNLLIGLTIFCMASPSVAQSTNGQLLSFDLPADQIPKSSVIYFNEKIVLSRIIELEGIPIVSSDLYIDGQFNQAGKMKNETFCYFYAHVDPRKLDLSRSDWVKVIPQATYATVVSTPTPTEDDWYRIHFEIPERSVSTYDRDFALACYMGLGTWLDNEDGTLQVKNIHHNLGNRIMLLHKDAQLNITSKNTSIR